ncbi:MAG: hypothetical protein JWP64_4043 [Pseudonocardia sp.]|jgi:hypothetical protein|nr:hypothetical protein [Pseudonocardia sp.]
MISTGRFGARAVVSEPSPYTTHPIAKARRLPIIEPILPPATMSIAITRV